MTMIEDAQDVGPLALKLNEGLGVMARLAAAWGQQFGVDADHVKPEARLVADLHFDSLDHVDAVMSAEDEFDLVIEDADVMQCVTVADYVALIQRLIKAGDAP